MSAPPVRRLLVVTSQRPFPTFHGANADAWRLILALRAAGWTIMLVSWRDSLAEDSGLKVINSVVARYMEQPMLAVRRYREWRTPTFAQARALTDEQREEILGEARRFLPRLVLSIGLYGASLGVRLANTLQIPHVYRSQAIEHDYYAQLFALERERLPGGFLRKARRWVRDELRCRPITNIEEVVLGSSALVLEISAEDAEIRRSRCGVSIEHIPPCAPEAVESVAGDRSIDVLYLGNLFMANNRKGLAWFLGEVLPILSLARPGLRIVVAGKSVDRAFEHFIVQAGVTFMPNVADAHGLLLNAKVAVNPIFSGNGTNVKTLDALWCGCGLVTTAVGAQGYAFEGGLDLRVGHSPVEFAAGVLDLLGDQPSRSPQTQRDRLDRYSIAAQGRRVSQILLRLPPATPVGV